MAGRPVGRWSRRVASICVVLAASACSRLLAPGAAAPGGLITLSVDATDIGRRWYHARETIPAVPGPLTLVYPKWIPGEHAPTGPIAGLTGLKMTAGGAPLAWARDGVDMFAFHVVVPAGATAVEVTLDFLGSSATGGFSAAASSTPHLGVVSWNQVLLYPRGAQPDDVRVQAALTLPAGWQHASALRGTGSGKDVSFAPVSLTTLVDSPVLAGEYFKAVPLDSGGRVELDLAGDTPASIAIGPDLTATLGRIVAEADALFGVRHFEDYHFLVSVSDNVAHFGVEHHQSSDDRVDAGAFTKAAEARDLDLLAHEYVHSWNGKYRRPTGLATPDYQAPMTGELLWVYEGLTEYLGRVLAMRSGLWPDPYAHERLAQLSAWLDHLPGREWRSLTDTSVSAQILYDAPNEWSTYRRSTDFYEEGVLLWLDADTLIRQQTNGQRSLDDFCRRFHGGPGGAPVVKPFTLDDLVAAMNDVAPYDWKTFFLTRVSETHAHAPLDGLGRGGWKLIYNDAPNTYLQGYAESSKDTEAGYSIGARVGGDGVVSDVIPGMPAFAAGLGPDMKVIEVNGRHWSPEGLHDALVASSHTTAPIVLKVDDAGTMKTLTIAYHDGLRQPHLERIPSAPDLLHDVIAPRAKR